METNFTIDLTAGLSNPEKAKEVAEKIQSTVDELVMSSKKAIDEANKSAALVQEYHKQVEILTKSNVDLTSVIKNMHLVLNARKERFKGDEAMESLMENLNKFVISSGAIKMGVLAKALEDEE